MMRKLLFLLIILHILSLIGCKSQDGLPELTDEKKQEIETAFGWKPNGWWDAETCYWGHRYYGSDNGYDILFGGGQMTASTTKYIAGKEFAYGSSFNLYAYKDGVIMDLDKAYTDGLISEEAIERAVQYHMACERAATAYRDNIGKST